jgi:hypothetical protein
LIHWFCPHRGGVFVSRALSHAGFLVVASCSAFCACAGGGHGSGADAGPDTESSTDIDSDGDSDGDGDSDTGPPVPAECPTALVPPCEDELYQLPLILSADSIAEGLRFVDATDYVIAGEREVIGGTEIFTVRRPGWSSSWFWGSPLVASFVESGRLVGIADVLDQGWESDGCLSQMTALLVCRESGACSVYLEFEFWDEGESESASAIEPLPRWSLPTAFAARRIRPVFEAAAVVVGNGAVALEWDGSVVEIVPPDSGAPLNDSWDAEIFVGEGGRVVRRDSAGTVTEEIDAGTAADLVSVAGLAEVAAADGALGQWNPELSPTWSWTTLATEPLVELHSPPSYIEGGLTDLVLTASGCAIAVAEDGACVLGVVPEPAARAVSWRCADSSNTDVVAPGGLYGYWDCYDMW